MIGGSGYSGAELLRLLVAHPNVAIATVASSSRTGESVSEAVPALEGHLDLKFIDISDVPAQGHDVVFFATPEGVASEMAQAIVDTGGVVIDIGPDFRLKSAKLWERWYGSPHKAAHLLEEAVYGLPEANTQLIRDARIIANPGCYPTAALLALYPLAKAKAIVPGSVIIDAKSGVTGAGKKTNRPDLLFAEIDGNLSTYGVAGHRHHPEILQMLEPLGMTSSLTFVPHLLPVRRGLLATIYVQPVADADLHQTLSEFHRALPLTTVLPAGRMPSLVSVRNTNFCHIGVHQPKDGGTSVIVSAIDNLGKGAAGQAVQNMNIRFGLDECSGIAVAPPPS